MYRNTQWIDEVKDQETEEVIQDGTPQSVLVGCHLSAHINEARGRDRTLYGVQRRKRC